MKWVLPALALVAACAGASDKPAQPRARPALWKIGDADTEIYLFGTIHVLPDGLSWRTPVFDKALARSQELVVEVDDLDDEGRTADTFLRLAVSEGLPPVSQRVPENRRAGLEALREKSGVPSTVLDRFETWAVAVTLSSGVLKTLDVSPRNGVDRKLKEEFSRRRRPVVALETTEQQLGAFDRLTEGSQRAFLVNMVDEAADPKAEFDRMIRAWGSGDEKGIALSFEDEAALTPELTDALLKNRNREWTEWLVNRLRQPGVVMVAVGAGHLAGDRSVQSMLAGRGIVVSRVQ
jgi:hypothetical protein